VAGVTVSLGESPAKSRPEEEKEEGDQRGHEQRDDLVLASIVLPEGERLGWPGLAAESDRIGRKSSRPFFGGAASL
jgi:hypothetical protein